MGRREEEEEEEEGREISVKTANAEIDFDGRIVTLCALKPAIGAVGRIFLVQGPAATTTSVQGIVYFSAVAPSEEALSVYVTDSTAFASPPEVPPLRVV